MMNSIPLSFDEINNPAHYTKDRTIQVIEVIEQYSVCYHLGNIIKYLSRAGRKGEFTNDILKAKWYLKRELSQRTGPYSCHNPLLQQMPGITVEDILKDWKLECSYLEQALILILNSQIADDSKQMEEDAIVLTNEELAEAIAQNHYDKYYAPLIKAGNLLNQSIKAVPYNSNSLSPVSQSSKLSVGPKTSQPDLTQSKVISFPLQDKKKEITDEL